MKGVTKIKKEQFLEAVKGSFGNLSYIARKLGVSRPTVYKCVDRWREAEPMLKDEREKLIDLSESKLLTLVNGGDFQAIRLVLERMGAERGWGEKKDVSITSNAPIQPIICFEPTKRPDGDGD